MSHRTKYWLLAGFAFVAAAIAGVAIGKMVPPSGGVENPALVLPVLLGLASLLLVPTWLWWRKMDDVQQQGQLLSWYWGGCAGAVVALMSMIVLTGRHSDFSLGATYLFLAQFAGMVLVWIVWRIRGRGVSE